MPCLIIAEAGVNHNGSLEHAKTLIEVAAAAGADYVKFQTFKAEKLVSKTAKKADYQKANLQGQNQDDSQYQMLKKLELDIAAHQVLIQHCAAYNIRFLSTAFDLESMDLLHDLGMDLYKIPSGEITNLPYLKKIGGYGKPIILSTGMSNLADIENALQVLLDAGSSRDQITVLHCNTEYPTPMQDVNLRAMQSIQAAFGVKVGYSDHTLGITIPIAAVAMGAVCIEKHFTLSKDLPGPDHRASLEPDELKVMVKGIRDIELALGNGIKQPSPSEIKNRPIARKSIHLAHPCAQGHILRLEDLIMKRPGYGISPMDLLRVLGRQLKQDLKEEHLLSWKDLDV